MRFLASPLLLLSLLGLAHADPLRTPESFNSISDKTERARAIFGEMSRVIFHPRCANCHPAGDTPLQGDDRHVHEPPVARGSDGEGVPALRCGSCHQDHNQMIARVPGAPKWQVAPLSMAWVGKSAHAVCVQLKDPARNGGRTLAQILDHMAHDALVAWGWAPGVDLRGKERAPAPGTQAQLGALASAWIELGAACPEEKK